MEARQAPPGSSIKTHDTNVVTHPWSFAFLPLKAANQPVGLHIAQQVNASSSESYSPLKGARNNAASSKSSSTSAAVQDYLQQLSAARSSAMAALADPDSNLSAVQLALNCYLAMLLDTCPEAAAPTAADSTRDEEAAAPQQQQQPLSASHGYLLRRCLQSSWADVLIPSDSSHSGSSSSSSSWWPAGKQQQLAAAAAAVTCRDALHELASVLLAAATWHMVKAAAIVNAGQTQSTAALEAYKHQRTAAGLLQYVGQQLSPRLVGWLGADLQLPLLRGLEDFALAEAQSLSLQRAMAKGHQPSLIAAIATDTASLYSSSFHNIAAAAQQQQQQQVYTAAACATAAALEQTWQQPLPGLKWGSNGRHVAKLLAYAKYQVCYCFAVAAVYMAEASLAASEAGCAVAWAQESCRVVRHVYRLGGEYDRLHPPTSREQRQQLERSLDITTQTTLGKGVRDNSTVYYQAVPKQLPPLAAPKRAAEPLPFQLPPAAAKLTPDVAAQLVAAVSGKQHLAAAAAVAGEGASAAGHTEVSMLVAGRPDSQAVPSAAAAAAGGAGDATAAADGQVTATAAAAEGDDGGGGCSCWRGAVLVICYPLLLLVSLIGVLVWLLLLPFKLCCCCLPCACAVQLMWNVVEYVIKAPLNGAIWAAGHGSDGSSSAAAGGEKGAQQKSSNRGAAANQGGTHDIEAP